MLGGLNTVAIDNLDPHPRQPRHTAAADLRNERPQNRRAVAYQLRRGVGFHAIEFIIDRDHGGPDGVFVVPIGRMERRLDAEDDLAE